MRVKSRVKAGINVGQVAKDTVKTVTSGTQAVLETGGREAGRLIGGLGNLITNPRFWTWPFNSSDSSLK